MAAGDITLDTLMEGFLAIAIHDATVRSSQVRTAQLIKPYLRESEDVLIAAYVLAAGSTGELALFPHELDDCLAVLRAAGREWGQENRP